jgi:hypothetical protein
MEMDATTNFTYQGGTAVQGNTEIRESETNSPEQAHNTIQQMNVPFFHHNGGSSLGSQVHEGQREAGEDIDSLPYPPVFSQEKGFDFSHINLPENPLPTKDFKNLLARQSNNDFCVASFIIPRNTNVEALDDPVSFLGSLANAEPPRPTVGALPATPLSTKKRTLSEYKSIRCTCHNTSCLKWYCSPFIILTSFFSHS